MSKIIIVGNGLTGILVTQKIINHIVTSSKNREPIEIVYVDPKSVGGNTYNRHDVSVAMANPVSQLGIPYKKHCYESFFSYEGLRESAPNIKENTYVTHNIYGMYLRGYLWELLNKLVAKYPHIKIIKTHKKAIDLTLNPPKIHLKLADGSYIIGDKLILATGNVAPRELNNLSSSPMYYRIDDEGVNKQHVNETKDITIIGMGNGAHYTALNAFKNGFSGVITLVSRDGKKPNPSLIQSTKTYNLSIMTPENITNYKKKTSLNQLPQVYYKLFIKELERAHQQGYVVWDVIDAISQHASLYWRDLSEEERTVLTQTVLIDFNNARFRIPYEHMQEINQLNAQGKLLYASGLEKITPLKDGTFELLFENGHKKNTAKIINNTGPSTRLDDMDDFIKNLAAKGIIEQHRLGGIKVNDQLQVVSQNKKNPYIYVAGPLVIGEFLNAFTVNEIRSLIETWLPASEVISPVANTRSKL